jgi:peptidoglycan-associated lipoprotein
MNEGGNMKTLSKLLLVVLAAVLISACGTKGPVKPEGGGAAVEDRTGAAGAEGAEGASARALPGQTGIEASALDDPASPLSKRIIYFDYDQSDISPEYRAIIEAHAQFLASNPNVSVVLEGNTDERGSREYNIGLGERRAEAVRRLLMFQGASDQQIRTVSYGEERPAAMGHDEAAWQENRRVVLVYKR